MRNILLWIFVIICTSSFSQQEFENKKSGDPHLQSVNKKHAFNDGLKNRVAIQAPTNDSCVFATVLSIDGALICNQATDQATLEASECYVDLSSPSAGLSAQSLWYRFTATNDSLVLNVAAYGANGPPSISVFGPFAPGAGCLPSCVSSVATVQGLSQDPGVHKLLTGLATTGNCDYLVSVTGFANLNWDFCINLANPALNTTANTASVINQCGIVINGTTNGGYYSSGTSAGFNNLDGNNGTTVAGASETGDDVTFVINNISWFKFCAVNAGIYNVQFDVISCEFTGVNSGSQMAILTGDPTSLTNIAQASNPTYTSSPTWISPNFTLAANGCAYLAVDGFSGDVCSYSYIINNVSGSCDLLSVGFIENELDKSNSIAVDYSKEETIDLIFYSSKNAISSFEVYNANGSLVIKHDQVVVNGRNIETIRKSNLSSGVYVTKLIVDGMIQIQKFIIN